jgi:hypothetical protein
MLFKKYQKGHEINSHLYEKSHVIFTDGSKSDESSGFAVHNSMDLKLEKRLQMPSSVFITGISARKYALDYIAEKPASAYIILTDSLSTGVEKIFLQKSPDCPPV